MNYGELWQVVLGEIELIVSKATYATWFKNTAIHGFKDGTIMISVPSPLVREWLETKFNKTILKIMRNYCENVRNVDYLIQPAGNTKQKQAVALCDEGQYGIQLKFKELQVDKETNLNPIYTFNNFIVGPFNELAHAATLNVIEKPGLLYNPLYIYGGVGLGKTHLLQAAGNELKKNYPALKIFYLSSNNFIDDYVESVREGTIHNFRKKYKFYDVIIIDDVQFFGGKDKTQDELFHLFNTFKGFNKQIIFSSDCPPKLIPSIEDRLRSRFEGGMMADISKPDFETRMAILKAKTANTPQNLKDEVLEYLALHITENIRELEGALNLITAELKRNYNLQEYQIKEILSKNAKSRRVLTAMQVIKKIAAFYNLNEHIFFEKTRKKEIVRPRQIAMYILREDFNNSYPDIGRKFGGKDHTTAMHSYEKILKELKTSQSLNEEVASIRNFLLN